MCVCVCVCVCVHIYIQFNTICSNMNGPRDYHSKQSQSERKRQIPYDITYMWNLKYDTNESVSMKQKQTHRNRE